VQNSDKLGLWLVLRLGSAVAAAYRPIAPILHRLRGLVSGGGKCLKLMPSTEAVASTGDLRYDVDSQYSPSRQLIA